MINVFELCVKILRKIDVKIKTYFVLNIIMKNIFHTQYNKKCLILYIITPFFYQSDTHTNQQMAIEIAKTFQNKGYNVDVAQYNTKRKINFQKYDLVFGFGEQFDKLLINDLGKTNGYKPQTIAILTGASPYYSNVAELNRLAYFKERNNATLMLRRQVHESAGLMNLEALQKVTAAICTGNLWTVNTWKYMVNNIYHITSTGFDIVKLPDIDRNLEIAKKNFLWFSGAGMLHKGLDLCIEAFRENADLNLYIAGTKDSDFYEFYEEDFKRENIHYCGFINVESEEYKELCENCMFCIFPSCSEGMATSVLTTMFSGMIPVVTKEAGVDIQDWGIKIEEIDVGYLTELIKHISEMEDDDLEIREEKAYQYAMANHTIDKFCIDLSDILDSVLCGN